MGITMKDAFPGQYLKKEDLDPNQDTVYTVSHGVMEEVGMGDEREPCPVIYFDETEKGLVVNKTNLSRIFAAHGATDTDELTGKKVSLYVDHEVAFRGKIVGGIRVRARAPEDSVSF